MSHFYGVMQGNRKKVTKCGDRGSGISATVATWDGAITVEIHHNAANNEDMVTIRLREWLGHGQAGILYSGPLSELNRAAYALKLQPATTE